MAIREQNPGKLRFDSLQYSCVRTVFCPIGRTFPNSRIGATKFSGEYHWIFAAESRGQLPRKKHYTARTPNNAGDGLR